MPTPAPRKLPTLSFRAFLEDAAFCNLTLTPTVAAIADASEGRPIRLDRAACIAAFGCAPEQLPREPRRTICVSAGGRGGKSSRLLAPKALHAALTVPLPDLRSEEHGRSVIIAPDKDLADQDLDYVRGYAEDSDVIRRLIVRNVKTCLTIRREDGTCVDIRVGAASRGGKAARARCLVFCGLDEASFFFTDESHAVTDKEIYRAATLRVVHGGQVWIVSTPWIEEVGILEQKLKDEFDYLTNMRRHDSALCVSRVNTHALNDRWDHHDDGSGGLRCPGEGKCARLPKCGIIEKDMRADDPENAAREIDAVPLAAGTSVFFDPAVIKSLFEVKAFDGPRLGVGAGFDGGFTSDCLAAAVVGRHRTENGDAFDWFDAHEQRPRRGEPLKPSVAVGSAAVFVKGHGANAVAADGHYKESVREHFAAHGVQFISAPEGQDGKSDTYLAARKAMGEGRVRISIPDPALREQVKSQLRSITKKPAEAGGIKVSAPRKKAGPTGGTVHGDLVSAGVLALWRAGVGKGGAVGEERRGVAAGDTRWDGVRGMRGGGRERRSDVRDPG